MPKRRKFGSESVTRLIVSVPVPMLGEIDRVTGCKYPRHNRYNRHPAFGNRSEFVRLAIVEKLERVQGHGKPRGLPEGRRITRTTSELRAKTAKNSPADFILYTVVYTGKNQNHKSY